MVIRLSRITNNQVPVAFLLSSMDNNLLNTRLNLDKVVLLAVVVVEVETPASSSPFCSSVSRMWVNRYGGDVN